MAILTKPGSVVKGESAEFTLDKTALSALVSDPDFQSVSDISKVTFIFKEENGQDEAITFDYSDPDPLKANFNVSSSAGDLFEISSIVLYDHDNDVHIIDRGDIPQAERDAMDVSPSPAP